MMNFLLASTHRVSKTTISAVPVLGQKHRLTNSSMAQYISIVAKIRNRLMCPVWGMCFLC